MEQSFSSLLKKRSPFLFLMAILIIAGLYFYTSPTTDTIFKNALVIVEGTLEKRNLTDNTLIIKTAEFDQNVQVLDNAQLFDLADQVTTLDKILPQFQIEVLGNIKDNILKAEQVKITKENNLAIELPRKGELVTAPIRLQGFIRGTTTKLNWEIRSTQNGRTLLNGAENLKISTNTDNTDFRPFSFTLVLPPLATTDLALVLHDGQQPINNPTAAYAFIPLTLNSVGQTSLQVFLPNYYWTKRGVCDQTFELRRTINKTDAVIESALRLLLEGPTPTERRRGFYSPFPVDTTLKTLTITDDRAAVVLSPEFYQAKINTCLQATIKAALETTAKQDRSIKEFRLVESSAP